MTYGKSYSYSNPVTTMDYTLSSYSQQPERDVAPPVAPRSRTTRLANGVELYFREAGDPSNPTLVLLHGFPTSSNYFRNLVPLLASPAYNYHVIAPDLPGFGATVCPENYAYTFQKLAETVVLLIDAIDITNMALYCMGEYGMLVALKVIQFKMENIASLIIQNGTVYNDSRLDSNMLDMYKTGLLTVPAPHSNSMLETAVSNNLGHSNGTEVPRYAPRSLTSSLRSSRHNSNLNLAGEYNQDSSGVQPHRSSSHVSFNLSVNEYAVDGSNSVHITTSRTPSEGGESDTSTENEDTPRPRRRYHSPTRFPRSSHLPHSPVLAAKELRPLSEPSLDDIKSLYLPCRPQTSSFSFGLASTSRTIDPHAYLFDYYLLIRPGQDLIQQSLFTDFLAHRKGIPHSSPTSMWLRTTNTPILILWGTNDPLLSETVTTENFKRDCRKCEIKMLQNGGHFALEYFPDEIAETIHEFFNKFRVNKAWSVSAY